MDDARWTILETTGRSVMAIIFYNFLIFYQIFLSPQVEPNVVIFFEKGIYDLPHELPNNLRLRILQNYIRKIAAFHGIIA